MPEDPDKDEFYLLHEAVDMVQEADYRQARAAFHQAQQRFIKDGKTDIASVTTAVEAMEAQLEKLQRLSKRRRIWKGFRHAFFFTQMAVDLLTATFNPVAASKAAISLGKFTVDEQLGNPASPTYDPLGGALLLDAHHRLNLTLAS